MSKRAISKQLKASNDTLLSYYPNEEPITLADVDRFFETGKTITIENHKTTKGEVLNYLTGIMYLASSNMSGFDVCPYASDGCRSACLMISGFGYYSHTIRGRLRKTLAFLRDRKRFVEIVKKDIEALIRKAKRQGMTPAVRLNGTSDIRWHVLTDIMQSFPGVQFYDYTKGLVNFAGELPTNYHLTFSLSEENKSEALKVLAMGHNVAVVFRNHLPETWNGYEVISGDDHDLRFLDKRGVVVGLKAKGQARKDESGFVQEPKGNPLVKIRVA